MLVCRLYLVLLDWLFVFKTEIKKVYSRVEYASTITKQKKAT